MKIHFVIHESYEMPAAILQWVEKNDYQTSYSRVYLNEALSKEANFDMLIVMGGPQSPATTKKECPYYDAPAEIECIKMAVDAGKKVFGVCLGAQLIGEAMGGTYGHSPEKEVGNFPITLTDDGKQHPIFKKFPESFVTGHWHGDMPGLTAEAKILATSEGCPRQIIEYAPNVIGFQCHLEFTTEALAEMIENVPDDFSGNHKFVQIKEDFANYDFSEMNQFLFKFLDAFLSN